MTAPAADQPAGTLVIGAGIAGLLLARQLQDAGQAVRVLEKSRGFGGRLATKSVGAAAFDSGAQFITATDPRFAALATAWRDAGHVAPWPDGPARRLIGRPTMNALARTLAGGLDIRREAKVLAVRREDGGWSVDLEAQGSLRARTLVLTAPAPQSLGLLAAGGVSLPDQLAAELGRLQYHPCLALLLALAGPSAVPPGGVAFDEGPVRWIADNTRKGVSPGAPGAVTVHLGRAFSAEHYPESEATLLPRILPMIDALLGSPVVHATLHRWKFSEPANRFPEPCVWLTDLRLGFAGDAFGGPKVEGAALSALELAGRMLAAPRAA